MLQCCLSFIFIIVTAGACFAHQPSGSIEGVVTRVPDGDSLQVTDGSGKMLKIRLYGIDAPQAGRCDKKTGRSTGAAQPFGEAASQALRGKVAGQKVRIDQMGSGPNDKVIAVVWLGSRNINHEMLAEGWAWAYRKHLDERSGAEYAQREAEARSKRLGLWQQANPQPPWEFRKQENMIKLFTGW